MKEKDFVSMSLDGSAPSNYGIQYMPYMHPVPVGQEKVVFITYVWIQLEGPAIPHICLDVGQSSKSVIKSTYLPLII